MKFFHFLTLIFSFYCIKIYLLTKNHKIFTFIYVCNYIYLSKEGGLMLGLILLYVGIVLISNGVARLCNIDPKSQSIMNIFTGSLSVISNIIIIVHGELFGSTPDFYAAATGLLFGFTYLYIALNGIFNLDQRLYGWYSLFVAINSIPAGIICILDGDGVLMSIIWWFWGVLWLTGFLETVLNKNLGKFVGYLSIFEGIFTAWIPGFLMLIGLWTGL